MSHSIVEKRGGERKTYVLNERKTDKNEDIKNDEKSKEANLNDQSKDKNFKASIMSSATDKTYKQEERNILGRKGLGKNYMSDMIKLKLLF